LSQWGAQLITKAPLDLSNGFDVRVLSWSTTHDEPDGTQFQVFASVSVMPTCGGAPAAASVPVGRFRIGVDPQPNADDASWQPVFDAQGNVQFVSMSKNPQFAGGVLATGTVNTGCPSQYLNPSATVDAYLCTAPAACAGNSSWTVITNVDSNANSLGYTSPFFGNTYGFNPAVESPRSRFSSPGSTSASTKSPRSWTS
jgi:hypothetical protein